VGCLVDRRLAALYERQMALGFLETQNHEADNDREPIHVVADDGAISSRVLPAENRVEDAPATTAIELWVAVLLICQFPF